MQPGDSPRYGDDRTDAGEKAVQKDKKIAPPVEPCFGPDNVPGLEKPVILLNKEPAAQDTTDPEQTHEACQASHGGGEIHAPEVKALGAHEKGPEGGDGIPGDGRKDVLHKGTQPERQIDEPVRKCIQPVQKRIYVRQIGVSRGQECSRCLFTSIYYCLRLKTRSVTGAGRGTRGLS